MKYTFQTGRGTLEINDDNILYDDQLISYKSLKKVVYSYGISMMHLTFKDDTREDIWLIHADLKEARAAEAMIRAHITSEPAIVKHEVIKEDTQDAHFVFETPHGKLKVLDEGLSIKNETYLYEDMKKAFYIVGSSVLNVCYKHKKRDLFWLRDTDLKTARAAERFIKQHIKAK